APASPFRALGDADAHAGDRAREHVIDVLRGILRGHGHLEDALEEGAAVDAGVVMEPGRRDVALLVDVLIDLEGSLQVGIADAARRLVAAGHVGLRQFADGVGTRLLAGAREYERRRKKEPALLATGGARRAEHVPEEPALLATGGARRAEHVPEEPALLAT